MKRCINLLAIIVAVLPHSACKGVGQPLPNSGPDGLEEGSLSDVDVPPTPDVPTDVDELEDLSGSIDAPEALEPDFSVDALSDAAAATTTCTMSPTLPEPGQPCDTVGEMRCTNVGSSTVHVHGYPVCLRPNGVVCEAGTNGMNSWVAHPSKEIEVPPGNCGAGKNGWLCGVVDGQSKFGSAWKNLCDSSQLGLSYCLGNTVYTCKFPTDAELNQYAALKECYVSIQSLPQWTPQPCLDEFVCKSGISGAGTKGVAQECVGSPTQPPHCAKSCEEMGEKSPGKP